MRRAWIILKLQFDSQINWYNEIYLLDNFEFTPSATYGWIDRGGINGFSFGLNAELSYKLNDIGGLIKITHCLGELCNL